MTVLKMQLLFSFFMACLVYAEMSTALCKRIISGS